MTARGPLAAVLAIGLVAAEARPAAAGDAARPDPAALAPTHIRVLVVDLVAMDPLLLDMMAQEAATLLAPANLELDWKRVPASTTSRRGETRVVLLAERARGGLADRIVLGASHAGRESTVWVFCPTVMREVGVGAGAYPALPAVARRRIGSVFGRIVTHELVHIMLPGRPHTRRGLMASEATRAWLLRRQVHLDAATLAALRRGAAGGRPGSGQPRDEDRRLLSRRGDAL